MFDVRSILDELLRSDPRSNQPRSPAGAPVQLAGLLGERAGADRGGGSLPAAANSPTPGTGGPERPDRGGSGKEGGAVPAAAGHPAGQSLEELLRGLLDVGHAPGTTDPHSAAAADVGDALGKLQRQAGQGVGGALDVLAQVLRQAAAGVREGTGALDAATGASQYSRQALEQLTGKSADEILTQLKTLIGANQLRAGAALGGLGALILGTQAGRSLAATAAKLGGLALIGGLAYKAYQNHQQGRPAPTGAAAPDRQQRLLPAPPGSGFEPAALSNAAASLLIRTMIAAAAADGRIDAQERQRILGSLRQDRSSTEAQRFLMQEVQRPASPAELASEVSSPEQAIQVYTAARIAVDVEGEEEHAFLTALASKLGIDAALAAQIDATVRGA